MYNAFAEMLRQAQHDTSFDLFMATYLAHQYFESEAEIIFELCWDELTPLQVAVRDIIERLEAELEG